MRPLDAFFFQPIKGKKTKTGKKETKGKLTRLARETKKQG